MPSIRYVLLVQSNDFSQCTFLFDDRMKRRQYYTGYESFSSIQPILHPMRQIVLKSHIIYIHKHTECKLPLRVVLISMMAASRRLHPRWSEEKPGVEHRSILFFSTRSAMSRVWKLIVTKRYTCVVLLSIPQVYRGSLSVEVREWWLTMDDCERWATSATPGIVQDRRRACVP